MDHPHQVQAAALRLLPPGGRLLPPPHDLLRPQDHQVLDRESLGDQALAAGKQAGYD